MVMYVSLGVWIEILLNNTAWINMNTVSSSLSPSSSTGCSDQGQIFHCKQSTAVGQVVACTPVMQQVRVWSPIGTSFLGDGFSSPVRQMSGSFRSPRSPDIIWPSLSSSIIIHYGHQWPEMLTHPKASTMHTYTANIGIKVAVLSKGRSSTANSGTKGAVLLFAHHSSFNIWTDLKRSEKI